MSYSFAHNENLAHNGKGYNSNRAARPQVLVNLSTADKEGSRYASLPPPTRNIDPTDSSQQHSKRRRLDDMVQNAVDSISETFGKESQVRESSRFERDTKDKQKKNKSKRDPPRQKTANSELSAHPVVPKLLTPIKTPAKLSSYYEMISPESCSQSVSGGAALDATPPPPGDFPSISPVNSPVKSPEIVCNVDKDQEEITIDSENDDVEEPADKVGNVDAGNGSNAVGVVARKSVGVQVGDGVVVVGGDDGVVTGGDDMDGVSDGAYIVPEDDDLEYVPLGVPHLHVRAFGLNRKRK